MKTQLSTLFALAAFACAAPAAPQQFDFKDPKGVNHAAFKLDAPLEAISGTAGGVSGSVTFDPENPAATKGKIVVTSASLTLLNSTQQTHMRGPDWLDAAKYPEITFETKELKNVNTIGTNTTAEVVGTFTLKGVSKELTVPVKFTYMKDRLSARTPNQQGDLLIIRASFSIRRRDFNIQPGQMEDKVSDTIDLALSIAGASPK
jgi:polyisoprenoid-binding protein YceI